MSQPSDPARDPASYRDPSGFVYRREGVLLRQIDHSFVDRWTAFEDSGLPARWIRAGQLIGYEPRPLAERFDDRAGAVIAPRELDLVSYPYEWTFGMLKDAALLTLDLELEALAKGFTLRDGSAYNITFDGARPVFIDSLSFEPHADGSPWTAYGQFCDHFLAPLALMARRDIRMGRMLRDSLEGIPLDLAAELLQGRSKFSFGLATHLHLHARSKVQHAGGGGESKRATIKHDRLVALISSLRGTVARLDWTPAGTEWADYADHTSYADEAAAAKDRIVGKLVAEVGGRITWDLGANNGRFSHIAAAAGQRVVALDIDPAAAEQLYRQLRAQDIGGMTPMVMDLVDPSPATGWGNRERRSLKARANADTLLALALVHHLAIGRNIPLPMILDELADYGPNLVIEWVPRGDPMVEHLLASREDIFTDYTEAGFLAAAERRWQLVRRVEVPGSTRILFLLRRGAR